MTPVCAVCLGAVDPGATHHESCARELFGSPALPRIDLDLARLHTAALATVGRTTLSGVQRKLSFGLTKDRATLQTDVEGARFIVKPEAPTYPELPANEHTTMRLAALAGIDIPPCSLLRLADDSFAYVVARFDRPPAGGKLRQEDFCQLAGLPSSEKYSGSAELGVRLVKRYATEPIIELAKLYRLLVFGWWSGNGDMHLKNFALLTGTDGIARLSPAYDQVCTRLVIPDDPLALPVGGKKSNLNRRTWQNLAAAAGLPERAALPILDSIASLLDSALALVSRSFLSSALQASYADLLRERTKSLRARRP